MNAIDYSPIQQVSSRSLLFGQLFTIPLTAILTHPITHPLYTLHSDAPTEWPGDNKTVAHSNNEWDVLRREHDSLVDISEALNHSHQALSSLNTPQHTLSTHPLNTPHRHILSILPQTL